MIGRMHYVILDCPDPPAVGTAHFRNFLAKAEIRPETEICPPRR